MAKPEKIDDPEKIKRLEEQIQALIAREDKKDIGTAEMLLNRVVRDAAAFFAYCPDDFGFQTGDWYDGHVVFGGTNRLHWSVQAGFWPSREHCTERFLAQFAGEVWEPIGYLDESAGLPYFEIRGKVGGRVEVPTAHENKHHAVLGRKGKDGRIAEVRILTGTEA